MYFLRNEKEGLQSNTGDTICPVPEADIGPPLRRWIPRHNQEIQLNNDIEDYKRVPCAKLWLR